MSLFCTSLMLVHGFLTAAPSRDAEDVIAGFRQNALRASTLVVRWRVDEGRGPRAAELFQQQLQYAEKRGAKAAVVSWRKQLDRDAEADHFIAIREFLTNRNDWQDRVAIDANTGFPYFRGRATPANWPLLGEFPNDLTTFFANVRITSAVAATPGTVRKWFGRRFNGHSTAVVGSRSDKPDDVAFPPLTLPEQSWNGMLHRIDEFFSGHPNEYSVLGETHIGDTAVILVERKWSWTGDHRLGCVRAFVDANRGYLPLRMEFFTRELGDEWRGRVTPLDKVGEGRFWGQLMVVDTIEEQSGVHYAMRGRLEEHGALFLNDKVHDSIAVMVGSWAVTELRVNEPIPAEVFALPFPDATLVHKGETGETFLSGDANDYLREVLPGQHIPYPRREWKMYWVAAGGSVLVVSLVIAVFLRRVKRKGP